MTGPKGEQKIVQGAIYLGGMCAECEGRGTVSDLDLSVILDESKSLAEGAILVPGYTADGWMVATFIESGFFDPQSRSRTTPRRSVTTSSTSRRSRSRPRASTSPTTG